MTIDKERLRVLIKELRTDARVDSLFGGAARNKLSARAADVLTEFEAENAALAAEVERLRKDAGRYQWLRGQFWHKSSLFVVQGDKSNVMLGTRCPSKSSLDDAIDAAMADKGGVSES